MSLFLQWPPEWGAIWPALVEIALLFVIIYAILRFLEGTRGFGVLRGLVFWIFMTWVLVVFFIDKLRLYRLEYLMGREALTFLLFIAVLFQPEIRRLLLRLGEAPTMKWMFHSEASIVPEIVNAVFTLSERKIGALIVVERETGLKSVMEGGTALNAAVTAELLVTIFWPGSPLHDGAVIIQGERAAAAGCLLPLTEQPGLAKTLGTRHRAAIGVTEESDALSIIVSEETQQVSVALRGQLRMGLDRDQLRSVLEENLIESISMATAGGNA